jgi:hypothetical protein
MTKVDVVFAGKAAHEGQGVAGVAKGGRVDVFEGLRADLDGRGVSKLFIGHATGPCRSLLLSFSTSPVTSQTRSYLFLSQARPRVSGVISPVDSSQRSNARV